MSRIRWAAIPVALALLTALALAIPASAATVVIQTLGRNAVTYTSYPSDPTPTAKWVASAQGESVDTTVPPNGVADSLRGRCAALEDFGIIRIRIYRCVTQALIGGVWTTVQLNETDAVSEAPRAYAVSYTTPSRYCATDPALTRSYRVLNPHAVRRVDGIVAYRTTVSHTFTARALASDPACPESPPPPPSANLEIDVQGATSLQHNQVQDLDVLVTNTGATAGSVTAIVDFTAGLTVENADSRCVLRTSTLDPNDYTCPLGIFGDGETANLDFDVRGTTLGAQLVVVSVSGTGTTDTDTDTLAIQVVESADLSLNKTVTGVDRDPATAGLQVRPGDALTYTFEVNSATSSADLATGVSVVDNWPTALGGATIISGATGGVNAAGDLVLQFGSVVPGTTETAIVTTTVDADVTPDSTVTNTAVVHSDQADPDTADRTDSASFFTLAPAA